MCLFDRLVWMVLSYGVEIWGWKEKEKMEILEERYIRWVLGVDGRTPGYLVREKMQRQKLKGRAGIRALGYEERLREGKGNELARMCWEEVIKRANKKEAGSGWEKERRKFLEDKKIKNEEIEQGRSGEGDWFEKAIKVEKEKQREKRWEKIENATYNKWYKWIKGQRVPAYLKKNWGESRWKRIARLGNEMREDKYWEESEKRRCRLCGGEKETWEHGRTVEHGNEEEGAGKEL